MPTRPRDAGGSPSSRPSSHGAHSYCQSGSSGCFRSHSGRRLVHHRQRLEVVRRRRRRRRPLERPGVPRIVAGRLALPQRDDDVRRGNRMATTWTATPSVETRFQHLPAASGRVGVDAARHAEQPGEVHGHEGQVEADDEQPEVPARRAAPTASGRSPSGTSSRSAAKIVKSRPPISTKWKCATTKYESRELPVERRDRQHDAGEARRRGTGTGTRMQNSIGVSKRMRPPYIVPSQLKILMPGRHRDQHRRGGEERRCRRRRGRPRTCGAPTTLEADEADRRRWPRPSSA